jgi:hypothetical protein
MTQAKHVYEVRPRKDKRGVDLISDGCHSAGCGMASGFAKQILDLKSRAITENI